MIDPLASRVLALALGLLLLVAAWHKLAARDAFVAALDDYRLLPAGLVHPVAWLLPVIEATLGLLWLAGVARGNVALATGLLLAAYAAAMAINLRLGRWNIGCGCGFGGAASGREQPLSWWLVLRNLLLIAAVVLAALPSSQRTLGAYDWLTLALALAALAVLYSGASQLMRNGAAIAAWRKPRA
jgi:hypothetical protein